MDSARRLRGAFVLPWVLLLLLAWSVEAAAGAPPPVATRGRLALDAVPQEPVPLRGEWGFGWQQFVDPGWEALPTRAFAPVPASWNRRAAQISRG